VYEDASFSNPVKAAKADKTKSKQVENA